MILDWKYDIQQRLLKLQLNEFTYTSGDGGRNISKYKNDFFLRNFSVVNHDGVEHDQWLDEIEWIAENYKDQVGILHKPWLEGYRQKDGSIIDIGVTIGNGVVSKENLLFVDRLCIPANFIEWWDYEKIAFGPSLDKDVPRDTIWYQHIETKQIVRTSNNNGPYPDYIHPLIHGPYIVDEDDIKQHGGVYFRDLCHPVLQM